MPNALKRDNAIGGLDIKAPAPAFSELAHGLHAMAQPLTILRGAMCAMTLHEPVPPADRRYLEMSTKQVDRLCDLMAGMQSLLHAAQNAAEYASFDLMELLEAVVEQKQVMADEAGVRIALTGADHALYAYADEQRTEQALSAALKTAIAVAQREDRIEIEVAPGDGFAGVTVRNENLQGKSLGSFERFHLTVVESILRSQYGAYQFTDNPFSLSLHLQSSEQPGAEVTSDCLQMAV